MYREYGSYSDNIPDISFDEEEIVGEPEDVIMIPDCDGIQR